MPFSSTIPLEIQRQRKSQIEAEILLLLIQKPGMQGRHIWKAIGNGRSCRFIKDALDRLVYNNEIRCKGSGFRENPYRYYVK